MIEIKEMLIRFPGLSAEGAESLIEEIARRIADEVPAGVGSRYLDNVHVQVTLSPGFSRRDLIEAVSAGISRGIK